MIHRCKVVVVVLSICAATFFSSQSAAQDVPVVDSAGRSCCVCVAAQQVGPRDTGCPQVDWGGRCEPSNQYTCFIEWNSENKKIEWLCRPHDRANTDDTYDRVPPTDCRQLHIINEVPDDKQGTPLDESVSGVRNARRACYQLQNDNEVFPQEICYLGSCAVKNEKQSAELCAEIRKHQKVRKENDVHPTPAPFPVVTYYVTQSGHVVDRECLGFLEDDGNAAEVYKVTLNPNGSVSVCRNGTCSNDLSSICPDSPVPPTQPPGPSTPPPGDRTPPATSDGAVQRKPTQVTVTVYYSAWCQHCERLKAQLHKMNIQFNQVNVDDLARGAPRPQRVPHTVIKRGDQKIEVSGNNAAKVQRAINALSRG